MSCLLRLTRSSRCLTTSFVLKPHNKVPSVTSLSTLTSSWTPASSSSPTPTFLTSPIFRRLYSNNAQDDTPDKKHLIKENIYTVPNFLCCGRIASAPLLAYLICYLQNYPSALALFGIAGITDLLDGWIARNFQGQSSMLGSFLDPLADKILVATLFMSLTYVGLIPIALTSLVVSRDVLLVYAGLYIRYMAVIPPFTFKKYFDVRMATSQVQPTTVSKVNTGFQLALVASALAAPVFDFVGHPAFHAFCAITAGTTFASAVSYAFRTDTYKFTARAFDEQKGKKMSAFVFFILFNAFFAYKTLIADYEPKEKIVLSENIQN